jgi:PEP-CTERM motif
MKFGGGFRAGIHARASRASLGEFWTHVRSSHHSTTRSKIAMRAPLILSFGSLLFLAALASPPQASAGWLVGSQLQISISDDPAGNSFNGTVTLGAGTTTIDNGLLTLTQTLVPEGPNAEWLVLDYQATGNGLIGGNPGIYWNYTATGQTDGQTILSARFFNWTANGSFFNSIQPLGGDGNIEPDPLNPGLGNVFSVGSVANTGSTWSLGAYLSPSYSYIGDAGINANTANGFVFAGLVTNAAVPEPSSLVLLGIASLGGLVAMKVRRRNR